MIDIFVFGSNLAGRHGAGAAKYAREHHGARYGQGAGIQGTSYGIPTKGNQKYPEKLKTLSLEEISKHVADFLVFAKNNPELRFNVTAIGCGLAGFTPQQIAPMFRGYSTNVRLPVSFLEVLEKE